MQFVLIAVLVIAIALGLMFFMKKKQTGMMKNPGQPTQQPKPPQQPPMSQGGSSQNTP